MEDRSIVSSLIRANIHPRNRSDVIVGAFNMGFIHSGFHCEDTSSDSHLQAPFPTDWQSQQYSYSFTYTHDDLHSSLIVRICSFEPHIPQLVFSSCISESSSPAFSKTFRFFDVINKSAKLEDFTSLFRNPNQFIEFARSVLDYWKSKPDQRVLEQSDEFSRHHPPSTDHMVPGTFPVGPS
ncbi:hypothetical protein GEMRC1_003723 [Eukaryota sp. GEM-RC1]